MGARRAAPQDRWPQLGFGVGLRAEHYDNVLSGPSDARSDAVPDSVADSVSDWPSKVDWFEAITENYMETGGRPLAVLESVRRDFPVALHGVSLSIGGTDRLDDDYLDALAELVERIEPAIVSDHLCWSSLGGRQLYDLLPLPLNEEVLQHVVSRVREVQDRLGRRILLENPSSYLAWNGSSIPEAEFLSEMAERADCGLLLDINNIHVTCTNMGLDPYAYIDAIAPDRVAQMHLAGFEDRDGYLFDTHSRPVSEEVWSLYRYALARVGPRSVMIEWDADIPSWSRLIEEVNRVRGIDAERGRIEFASFTGSHEAADGISDSR